MHLCIQKIDESKEYQMQDIENLIQNLIDREIITQIEADVIDKKLLCEYTKSELFKELKQAKQIYKEQPFYINIPAKEIYEEAQKSEKSILVQGMIDLYYIDKNDKIHLIDFKTDYVPKGKEKQIADKYVVQIEIYKKAIEKATGKEVASAKICLANSKWKCIDV